MKNYPLDVRAMGDHGVYWSKGHQEHEAFLHAVDAFCGEPMGPRFDFVRHEWWRTIPARYEEDYRYFYDDATPGSRGAFPVTVVEVRP